MPSQAGVPSLSVPLFLWRRLTEQPSSSLMQRHPRYVAAAEAVRELTGWVTVRCWLGMYGSHSPKLVQVFGTGPVA